MKKEPVTDILNALLTWSPCGAIKPGDKMSDITTFYDAMAEARRRWGNEARIRQSCVVQTDGRLNIQYEVGGYFLLEKDGKRQNCIRFFGGGSWNEAFREADRADNLLYAKFIADYHYDDSLKFWKIYLDHRHVANASTEAMAKSIVAQLRERGWVET